MKKKLSVFFCFALLSVAVFMVISGTIIANNNQKTHFTEDVYINGTNVRGYTAEKANALITEKMKKNIKDINIKLVYKDKVWQFDSEDFDVNTAVRDVVNTAFKNSKIDNKQAVDYIFSKTDDFHFAINNVLINFDERINEIIDEINVEPKNARVEFQPDSTNIFNVIEEENGVEVDKERLLNDINLQFLNSKDITVYIHTKKVEPEIKSDYFDDKLSLQSKF